MAKGLVIVESPAKSHTIGKILGDDYEVMASLGHLVDLPIGKVGIDFENNFEPTYVVIKDRKKILLQLKKAAKDKEAIYLAADPDREGEAISWHISKQIGVGKKIYRVRFYEITKEAVLDAFKNADEINMNLVNSQQARRILDRIVGYKLSPLLWKKVGRGLSAGRVQSVAVKIVVDREKEIQAFKAQEYWDIEAELSKKGAKQEESFIAKLDKKDLKKVEIKNKKEADDLVEILKKQTYVVKDIKETKKHRKPPAPFTTSKLQQEAFNKLRYPVHRTMKIAQELYEGVELGKGNPIGLITYMRTDSTKVASVAQQDAKKYIIDKFGKEYAPKIFNVYKVKKNAQEAHEAIRPALPLHEPEGVRNFLSEDQFKLYKLIWDRFLASQMKEASLLVVTVDIKAGAYTFRASGTTVLFDGFLKIYIEEDEENGKKVLPKFSIDEVLDLLKLDPSQHFTKPPPRFSDASLVKVLEEEGIGRPSTYAPIIYTIISRHYVVREKGYLRPTDLGMIVTELLVKHFSDIMDPKFTAKMEEELDDIEERKQDKLKVLNDFYGPFSKALEKAADNMRDVKHEIVETNEVCELCGKKMVIKWSRRGRFLSCSGYPECKGAKSISTGIKCPVPNCGGELVERRSKRGIFYGCTKYPKCTHITNKLPEQESNNSETNNSVPGSNNV
ncbi:MAG: type I DNA topoisomerase [Candidatus Omnitrophica bacterium CG07_land_8_20_14_0_80_42_15]|uniref:DNA topoisomerase 1 n=1 Tax=Candidatus Aquitaenariimonas noxiae TaxID=1974741 RepID=A0A2J0L3D1_9BACT|nr:MAG: type I DNA topoisomerase [Candidatus Omnitrophica bacterium CG07_land_8_20_14_0_80_42_15]